MKAIISVIIIKTIKIYTPWFVFICVQLFVSIVTENIPINLIISHSHRVKGKRKELRARKKKKIGEKKEEKR